MVRNFLPDHSTPRFIKQGSGIGRGCLEAICAMECMHGLVTHLSIHIGVVDMITVNFSDNAPLAQGVSFSG